MVILDTSDHYKAYGSINNYFRKTDLPLYLHRVDGDGIYQVTGFDMGFFLKLCLKDEGWSELRGSDVIFSNYTPPVEKKKVRKYNK